MMCSAESAVCLHRIAVAVSLSHSFIEFEAYVLSQLGMQHLEATCRGNMHALSLWLSFGSFKLKRSAATF